MNDRETRPTPAAVDSRQDTLLATDRLATLGTLAGGIGHELNNMAAVFKSSLAFMEEDLAAGRAPEPEDLEALHRVLDHLSLHARHLLHLGRPGPEHQEELDLREATERILGLLQVTGKTKYVEVATRFPADRVPVTVNRIRLEQILVNLVSNAVDALAERDRGGRIEVRLESGPEPGRVTCEVVDNGGGIPPDRLERVFEPYFTTKPPGRGTGLGLPVVRQIVASYGGRLTVESRQGEGAVFRFDLPLSGS